MEFKLKICDSPICGLYQYESCDICDNLDDLYCTSSYIYRIFHYKLDTFKLICSKSHNFNNFTKSNAALKIAMHIINYDVFKFLFNNKNFCNDDMDVFLKTLYLLLNLLVK